MAWGARSRAGCAGPAGRSSPSSCTTVYGQLISVYEYPQAALLVLGGSTVAALAVGFVYGKGKRVWCRHLCPANGVFALLAKLAPLHFAADERAWREYGGRPARVDCAPLVDRAPPERRLRLPRLRPLQRVPWCDRAGARVPRQRDSRNDARADGHSRSAAARVRHARHRHRGVPVDFQPVVPAHQDGCRAVARGPQRFRPAAGQRALVAAHALPAGERRVHLARRAVHPRLHPRRRARARRRRVGGPAPRRPARARPRDLPGSAWRSRCCRSPASGSFSGCRC